MPHAGRTETSLLLAIEPAAVRLSLAEPGCTEPLASVLPRLRACRRGAPVSSNGVLGDPTGASAEEGRAVLETLVADLAVPWTSGGPPDEPVALVTGAARGIGAAMVDAAGGSRLAGGGVRPCR